VWWASTAIRSQVPDESTFASKNDRPILVCRLGRQPQLSIRVDICALWWCVFGLHDSLNTVNGSILRRMQLLCSNAVIQFQPDQSSIHDSRVVHEWPAFWPMSNLTTDTSATWNEPQGEYVAWGKDTRACNVARPPSAKHWCSRGFVSHRINRWALPHVSSQCPCQDKRDPWWLKHRDIRYYIKDATPWKHPLYTTIHIGVFC
jgi:hypothetical protein